MCLNGELWRGQNAGFRMNPVFMVFHLPGGTWLTVIMPAEFEHSQEIKIPLDTYPTFSDKCGAGRKHLKIGCALLKKRGFGTSSS